MSEPAGAINAYVCDTCDGRVITINRVEGTTPFMISCEATPGCGGVAQSQFYQVDQSATPTFEWFKPTTSRERKVWIGDDLDTAYHVKHGGLLLRAIG